MAITIVGPGERGILIQLGNMQGIFGPGLHFKIPVIQNVVTIDVRTQKEQVQVDAASKDLQSIRTLVALNYHVDPARVDSLYQEIGVQYVERIIDPAIQESVKAATAQFTAEELITKRPTVKEEIKAKLVERLSKTYIEIDDFSIVDFTFSDSFNAAIEAKQTAVQQALKAENDLKRIEIEAQQQIEKAKADAESIRIQGDALKENQGLVQLKFVEKWDGVLPTYVMGSNVPLLNMLPTASS
jgi:prohibitin 2